MRKSDFCIYAKKDADQLHSTAPLFRYIDSTIPLHVYCLNLKFQASNHLLWLHSRFVSDLVGNPEDRFSYVAARIPRSHYLLHSSVSAQDLSPLMRSDIIPPLLMKR